MNTHLTPVLIPLLNPNEPEANLVSLEIREGQFVAVGELLCTLETTKSVADVVAEHEGYVTDLNFSIGKSIRAGEILCYLADSPTPSKQDSGLLQETSSTNLETIDIPEGLRITQPALNLASQENFDLNQLPIGPLITESVIQNLKGKTMEKAEFLSIKNEFDPGALIIYGGGGHGKMLIDLVRVLGVYNILGIIDDGLKPGDEVMGVSVLGNANILPDIRSKGVKMALNAVGGIGDVSVRVEVFKKLTDSGFVCPAVVHPTAIVEPSANLSPGVQIFANAYIGSQVQISFGVIVNTCAIISHDCILNEYAIVSPGAILAGEVQAGKGSLIGMGATINLRTKIGDRAQIGNGATVKEDVPPAKIVRAGSIWPAK